MNHTISLAEKTEQALRALADEQGMSEEEYLRRLIEAWGAGLPEGRRRRSRRWAFDLLRQRRGVPGRAYQVNE